MAWKFEARTGPSCGPRHSSPSGARGGGNWFRFGPRQAQGSFGVSQVLADIRRRVQRAGSGPVLRCSFPQGDRMPPLLEIDRIRIFTTSSCWVSRYVSRRSDRKSPITSFPRRNGWVIFGWVGGWQSIGWVIFGCPSGRTGQCSSVNSIALLSPPQINKFKKSYIILNKIMKLNTKKIHNSNI